MRKSLGSALVRRFQDMAAWPIDDEKETRLKIGLIRCKTAHVEMCTLEMYSANGRPVSDPEAEIELVAVLLVRDFTSSKWAESGKGASRRTVRVVVDLENSVLVWGRQDELRIVNLDEIMDGIRDALTGTKYNVIPFKITNEIDADQE